MYTSYARVMESVTVTRNRGDWMAGFIEAVAEFGFETASHRFHHDMEGMVVKAILPNKRWLTGRMHFTKGGFTVIKQTGKRRQMMVDWIDIDRKSIRFVQMQTGTRMQFKVVW